MAFQWARICNDQFKSKERVSKVSPWKHCEGNKDVLDLSSPSDPHHLYLGLLSLSIMSQEVVYRPEWSIRITWASIKKWSFPDAILSLLNENDWKWGLRINDFTISRRVVSSLLGNLGSKTYMLVSSSCPHQLKLGWTLPSHRNFLQNFHCFKIQRIKICYLIP